MLIDSHAHIQLDNFDVDRGTVLERAQEAGVHAMMVIGFDLETSRGAIALAAVSYTHLTLPTKRIV